jgi:hypothetical protein
MFEFISQNIRVPLDSIVRSSDWLASEFRFVRTGDPIFRDVCDVLSSIISDYSVRNLKDFWTLRPNRYFDFSTTPKYLELKESVCETNKFLLYQFDGQEECVKGFLIDLLNILDRKYAKRNCLVVSPPTSGKNWFFDSILIFSITDGQIQNAKKSCQFPLDNCFNKRILYFNEPQFEASFEEKLLMLFAGDPMSDNAKYRNVSEIKRTPVIVTSNRQTSFLLA